MRVYVRLALLLGVVGVLLLSGEETVAAPGGTRRVSLTSAGAEGDGISEYPATSADGRYVAFHSRASNLVPGDTNGCQDVFVHDRQTAATERVSVATGYAEGTRGSLHPAVSADGRYVAFDSWAPDLVAGDTNDWVDIFVRDRQTNTTERVSLSSGGVEGNDTSWYPAISGDGRFVAFQSFASNLVAGDTNVFCQNDLDPELENCGDIFVRDRQTSTTVRVSVSTSGTQGNEESSSASISSSGRFVVFTSRASNLVASDTNGKTDIFVRDRDTNTTIRVSVHTSGTQGNGDSDLADVSSDGRYVVFSSDATNLVTGDTNGKTDVFVRDRQTSTTKRLSLSTSGVQGNNWSYGPSISSVDGRFVAFESWASNLVTGDTNNVADVFVRDRDTDGNGTFDEPGYVSTTRVSVSTSDYRPEGNGESGDAAISGDGSQIAFWSSASNLVVDDTNGVVDVFVHNSVVEAVGGIAELPDVSGSSPPSYISLAGLAAAVLALLSAGAWFTRRRAGPGRRP